MHSSVRYSLHVEDGPSLAFLPDTLRLASSWRSQQGFLLKIWCSVKFGYPRTLIKQQFIQERPYMRGQASHEPPKSLPVFGFGRSLHGFQGGRR